MLEIERRFVVERLPDRLPEPCRIEQGYLMISPAAVRVRSADGHHTLTVKTGAGLTRTEIERVLEPDEFAALWEVATESRVVKARHRIRLDADRIAELDVFDGELSGRALVEVEFDDETTAASFVPPDWFGSEVTDDARFTNSNLGRFGWPDGLTGR